MPNAKLKFVLVVMAIFKKNFFSQRARIQKKRTNKDWKKDDWDRKIWTSRNLGNQNNSFACSQSSNKM